MGPEKIPKLMIRFRSATAGVYQKPLNGGGLPGLLVSAKQTGTAKPPLFGFPIS